MHLGLGQKVLGTIWGHYESCDKRTLLLNTPHMYDETFHAAIRNVMRQFATSRDSSRAAD